VLFNRSTRAVNPHEARKLIDRGALIVDVRELSEWNHGHAPEAVHIPMVRVEEQLHRIPKDSDVIVCCRSGSRSSSVTTFLLSNGYKAVNLEGGMAAWHAHGLPVVNSNGVRGNII